jgi:hypothetical protein
MPAPDIWIAFSTDEFDGKMQEFQGAVKGYFLKVESGKYEKFISG